MSGLVEFGHGWAGPRISLELISLPVQVMLDRAWQALSCFTFICALHSDFLMNWICLAYGLLVLDWTSFL